MFRTLALGIAMFTAAFVASAQTRLQGAGATFPNPLYSRLVVEYQKVHPGVAIDYQSIGSGGGIKAITEKTVDFAGSDAPLNKKQLEALGADNVIQVPSCAGGVAPAYNLPGITKDLKFTGEVLADIYLGKITKWNDAKLAALNEGVTLPDMVITPAWRTDGSGTTYVFTNYLATQSESFKETIGMGTSVKWPLGQGGKGNEGVAAVVQQTPGAIGYIEENYAVQNKLAFGMVKNKDGQFVKASPESISLAGAGAAAEFKGDVMAANLWNQGGEKTYPIASFTYLIVYKDLNNVKSKEQAQALVDFLWWATHGGQKMCSELEYAPLAPEVQAKVGETLMHLTYKGEAVTPQK
ncbi:MAG: phosphate ABC transporter substrate-binding protein PstS [Tepidisphaeraceae bacterium]|jgi:phosphate transport system substrate-binding protein